MKLKEIKETHTDMCAKSPKWHKKLTGKICTFTRKSKVYSAFARLANGHRRKVRLLNYYTAIDDIPLFNFAKCCEGELIFLSKTGKYSESTAKEIWKSIVAEYNDSLITIKDIEPNIQCALMVAKVRMMEGAMGNELTQDAKRALRWCGVRLTGNDEQDTAILFGKINSILRELENVTANIKTNDRRPSDTIKAFSEILCSISAYYKLRLDIKTISVREYCTWVARYTREIKEIEKQRNGRRINK